MNIQWDPKIGPATIVSIGGALAILVTIGAAWGTLTTKLDHVLHISTKTDDKVLAVQKANHKQDEKIAAQSSQISGMQATINFLVPTLQRIEQRLESAINHPRANGSGSGTPPRP